jgi:hypothetical protein
LEIKKSDGETQLESLEYLLDLRSNLLMTEVPPELEEEIQAAKMIESFVSQLQILSEIADVLSRLYILGHIEYQAGFSLSRTITIDGISTLKDDLKNIEEVAIAWEKSVNDSRHRHYYLNFFTMREILRMRHLALQFRELDDLIGQPAEQSVVPSAGFKSTDTANGAGAVQFSPEQNDCIDQIENMGFDRLWATVALKKNNWDIGNAINFIFSNDMQRERLCEEELLHQGRSGAVEIYGNVVHYYYSIYYRV